jgi:hypothetical protein
MQRSRSRYPIWANVYSGSYHLSKKVNNKFRQNPLPNEEIIYRIEKNAYHALLQNYKRAVNSRAQCQQIRQR